MDKTEEKIIQATIEWIMTADYRQLSMRKLAAQIGMTTGALYKHYRSKEELFYQVSVRLSQRVTERLLPDRSLSAKEQLLTLANSLCQLCVSQPQLVDFLFFNPGLKEFYQHTNSDFQFYNQVMALIRQLNPGTVSDQDLFTQVWAFIQGYTFLIMNGAADYDADLVATTLNQLVGKGAGK
ncbi:TetR/AcrR family transcriptional regulator [Limosilactobacillus antri]|uniref:TetR/AcrR family transcriptional regulator n=1 Tax=Limosilactobacillus antri TaxID=227943 RepID=UPI001F5ADA9B|nr:TetR/AcrR family transcriptional regulator [Limosilactobacillus antri]